MNELQWWIQDFPGGGGGRPPNPKVGLFCGLFAENYMKMRPLGSANELSKVFIYWQNHLLDDDICTGHFSLFYDMYYVIFCLILQYYLPHYTIKRRKGWKNSFINSNIVRIASVSQHLYSEKFCSS